MAHSYNGVAANATGTTVTVMQPDDGDNDNAAAQNTQGSRLADWLQRLANIALNIGATAFTWTVAQAFPTGTTIALPTINDLTGSLGSGWSKPSGGYLNYWNDALGLTHVECFVAASGSPAATIAQLPLGYRPN